MSIEHYNASINDKERCLEICIIDSPHKIVILYFEVLLRMLHKFFYNVSADLRCSHPTDEFALRFGRSPNKKREHFLDKCSEFLKQFFKGLLPLIYSKQFETIFSEYTPNVDYST